MVIRPLAGAAEAAACATLMANSEPWRTLGRTAGASLAVLSDPAKEVYGGESPNVFLCVSSFNGAARRLYERLGYRLVGTLSDYLVAGHDEHLLRKSMGSWGEFHHRGNG